MSLQAASNTPGTIPGDGLGGGPAGTVPWVDFVLAHGFRAQRTDLAAVVGQPVEAIDRLRATGACRRLPKGLSFADLFVLWHGRPPAEEDWPTPIINGGQGYEWQPPEVALLATLTGQVGPDEIAQVLTRRLREKTGDPAAVRTSVSVLVRMNKIGLQTTDVLGGLTIAEATREIGSLVTVQTAIRHKTLRAWRSGRLWVIPYAEWERWKKSRVFPPDGYVALSTLREPLAILSDKLSEFARMGYIPTAVRCNPYGQGPSTQFGTWFIDPAVAQQMLQDRAAGRPMPWQGKPLLDNLRVTYRLWQTRMHPIACQTCAQIWASAPPPRHDSPAPATAPTNFDDYVLRYPGLAHGAKRHLTMKWTPGLTLADVARQAVRSVTHVQRAIEAGALEATTIDGRLYVTRTDATRWIARKCPSGEGEKSWLTLSTACKQYLFTPEELRALVDSGQLLSKIGTDGAMRGIEYVARHQCGTLREKVGFTLEQAAQRVGVSVERMRVLLDGLDWRASEHIPLDTVKAAIKRYESRAGYSLTDAAGVLRMPLEWVKARVEDGTVKVKCAPWNEDRPYLTYEGLERLRSAIGSSRPKTAPDGDGEWIGLGDAALDAGVTSATILKWADQGLVERVLSAGRWRYRREPLRAQARLYWATSRSRRRRPPPWLGLEGRDSGALNPAENTG